MDEEYDADIDVYESGVILVDILCGEKWICAMCKLHGLAMRGDNDRCYAVDGDAISYN